MVYTYMDNRGRTVAFDVIIPRLGGGVHVRTNPAGVHVPDDEIPGLISALQNYMSRRAKEITEAARGAK